MEFITNPGVKKLWEANQPANTLQMIWHLPQPATTTVSASYYGPMSDLWFDLMSWDTSAIQNTIASGVPRKPVHLDIRESTAFLAAYAASPIQVDTLDKLQRLIGDSHISWAIAPTTAAVHQMEHPVTTPSQFRRTYTLGKPFTETPALVPEMQIFNFEVEPRDVQATQSPKSIVHLIVADGNGDNISGLVHGIMDLRHINGDINGHAQLQPMELEVSTSLLPQFNLVQSVTKKELQDTKAGLTKLQNAMNHP